MGNLYENKLDFEKALTKRSDSMYSNNYVETHKTLSNAGQSLVMIEKPKENSVKLALINKIDEMRRNSQTPKVNLLANDENVSKSLKKAESLALVPPKKEVQKKEDLS